MDVKEWGGRVEAFIESIAALAERFLAWAAPVLVPFMLAFCVVAPIVIVVWILQLFS